MAKQKDPNAPKKARAPRVTKPKATPAVPTTPETVENNNPDVNDNVTPTPNGNPIPAPAAPDPAAIEPTHHIEGGGIADAVDPEPPIEKGTEHIEPKHENVDANHKVKNKKKEEEPIPETKAHYENPNGVGVEWPR